MHARALSIVLVAVFAAVLVVSLIEGDPSMLPGVAMGSPLLLHLMRAVAASALIGAATIVVTRLWRGELPVKLSTTGAEWAPPLAAPSRDVHEQLLHVERESRAAVEELARRLELIETRVPAHPDAGEQPTGKGASAAMWSEELTRWRDAIRDAERQDAVAEAVGELPERSRLVIALRFYEGHSTREIAEMLGTSVSSVDQMTSRALRHLRQSLGYKPFDVQPRGENRPVTWTVIGEPEQVASIRDALRLRYLLQRGDGAEREVFVEVSGTAAASDPDGFPPPLDEAIRTRGRSVIEQSAHRVEPPAVVFIDTQQIVIRPRQGFYEPGDRVYVFEGEAWQPATVERLGERDDAIKVRNPAVVGGVVRRDVVWVERLADGVLAKYQYDHVRAQPPDA